MTYQVIAIDYGLKRVGIAIGNSLTKHAQALTTLQNSGDEALLTEINSIVVEWKPRQLIMGMPFNPEPLPDQEPSKKQSKLVRRIKQFAIKLGETTQLPVEFIDESFSSSEASRQLKYQRQTGIRNKAVSKEDVDKAAASIILQRWLDNYC